MANSPHQKRFNFAESNHKIRMELRQSDLKLQKEIELMEKQTYTATNNISNHQQVLKNSWRRLEQKRQEDQLSPLGSRKTKKAQKVVDDGRKRLMFANKTYLSMDVTPNEKDISSQTRPMTQARYGDDLSSSGSLPFIQERTAISSRHRSDSSSNPKHLPTIATNSSTVMHMQRSPYISSPYAFRRQHEQTKSFSSKSQGRVAHPLVNNVSSSNNHSVIQLSNNGGTPEGSDTQMDSDQKVDSLPSLDASMNTRTRQFNISSKTVSKNALLKAREIMNMDSDSHGPMSFKKFYDTSNSSSNTNSKSQMITLDELEGMTEDDLMNSLTDEEQEQLKTAKEEVSITSCAACMIVIINFSIPF